MPNSKISILLGSDHAGFVLKEEIKKNLKKNNTNLKDIGIYSYQYSDYPIIAFELSKLVAKNNLNFNKKIKCFGILICGTGIGVSIVANKIPGIRAALCSNEYHAQMARKHNNANIICFGSKVTSVPDSIKMIKIFLETDFEGGRHEIRLKQIEKLNEPQENLM
ncbi:MAG: ribose 5-phosphate isomerase B [Oscillospiraceae bacterium]|jgi:ribose 5-phosphate isomerase B|nr:ribose 5-phosphate isomerase B [Oscillospiraceae bacterium]